MNGGGFSSSPALTLNSAFLGKSEIRRKYFGWEEPGKQAGRNNFPWAGNFALSAV
jgi:hypothetical protein